MSSEKLKDQIQVKLESRIEGALREFHGEIDKKVKKTIISASKDLAKKLVKSIEKASKKAKSTVIIINKTDKKLPIPALATQTVSVPKTVRAKRVATPTLNSSEDTVKPKLVVRKPEISLEAGTAPIVTTRKKPGPKPKVAINAEVAPVEKRSTRAPRKKNA